ATGRDLDGAFHAASDADVADAAVKARDAFSVYRSLPNTDRAAFLRAIADELEAARPDFVARVPQETALPEGRVNGELGRTIGQMRLFADVVEEGSWVDARLERPQPNREPVPKPDLRSMRVPMGPVAVFGASNFPLAFSVAGGDTASALAAGCPVVAVAHYAHPGTCEIAGEAIVRAAKKTGMPDGVFSMLQGTGQDVGVPLVEHPAISAVGFTGSRRGGLALSEVAAGREEPVPVFAEMSSVNPVVLLPGALADRSQRIAEGLAGSVSLGVGQFCTNPGLVFVPDEHAHRFAEELAAALGESHGGTALHSGIARAYEEAVSGRRDHAAVETVVASPNDVSTARINPHVFQTTLSELTAHGDLAGEAFGPATTLVSYDAVDELSCAIMGLEGQLTGTIHYADSDLPLSDMLVAALRDRAGRLILNGFPTGVEVCHAMVHGGPYPATSDGRTTSVGTAAIERWTRRFCYQDAVPDMLPPELKDGNPLGIRRMVDGAYA
ncbi:MAG: aldehyde dehydrogenase (NADP(+)), partial [Rhodothermales bacterium]|nr:aldehyde dehydrogenase (NADP(+)) [Rhodothermales bacterium]